MATPWQKLKEAETAVLAARRGGSITKRLVTRLRNTLRSVQDLPDAEHAIVFHGAWSLIHEVDGNLVDAVRHRAVEVVKIRRLHASVRRNPASKWVLRDYGLRFLASRQRVLAQLRAASKVGRRQ